MVGVVIGASKDSIHAIKCAKKMGLYVVAMDGNSEAEGLKEADNAIVLDISNFNLVYNELKDTNPIFCIPAPIGRCLTTIGFINDQYKMKGISRHAAQLCTDKYMFHKRLYECGLRNINSYLIRCKKDYIGIKNIRYPIIIKPRFGSGGRGVVIIRDEQEFLLYIAKSDDFEEDYIIEEAVSGTEYGVDGAVIEDKLYLTLLRRKIITNPPARLSLGYYSTIPTEENKVMFHNVSRLLEAVVKTLEINNCIIHADVIIENSNVFLIEISGRPSGHYLHDIFTPFVTGIDLVYEYMKYEINGKGTFTSNNVKNAAICFFNFQDCFLEYIPSASELKCNSELNIIKYISNLKKGQYLGQVNSGKSLIDRGYFIVTGETENHINKQIDTVFKAFKLRVKEKYV